MTEDEALVKAQDFLVEVSSDDGWIDINHSFVRKKLANLLIAVAQEVEANTRVDDPMFNPFFNSFKE